MVDARVGQVDFNWLAQLPQIYEQAQSKRARKETLADLDINDVNSLETTARNLLRLGTAEDVALGLKIGEMAKSRVLMQRQEEAARRNEALLGQPIDYDAAGAPSQMPSTTAPQGMVPSTEGDQTVRGTDIYRKLIQRGIPAVQAAGIAGNFFGESGYDPGVNERAPVVPGSRGGFGLGQWTGPRRVALENFARERGKPVSDIDTQLDFVQQELQGPEARARRGLEQAQTPAQAAQVFEAQYQRPGIPSTQKRVAEAQRLYAQTQSDAPEEDIAAAQRPAPRAAQPTRKEIVLQNEIRRREAAMANPYTDQNTRASLQSQINHLETLRKEEAGRRETEFKSAAENRQQFNREDYQAALKVTGEVNKQAETARSARGNIQRLLELTEKSNIYTGPGAQVYGRGAAVLTAAGEFLKRFTSINPEEYKSFRQVKDAAAAQEQFQALSAKGVFDLLGGFGAQISNEDRRRMEQTYASLGNTLEANKAMLRFYQKTYEIQEQEAEKIGAYMKEARRRGLTPDPDQIETIRSRHREQGRQVLQQMSKADAVRFGAPEPQFSDEKPKGGSGTAQAAERAPQIKLTPKDEGRPVIGPDGQRYIIRNGVPVKVEQGPRPGPGET